MVPPVVGVGEGDADQGHALPLRGGDQAAAGFFGEAGFQADAAGIFLQKPVVIGKPAVVGRVAVAELQAGLGAETAEVRIFQGRPGQEGHVGGGGVVALAVQARS